MESFRCVSRIARRFSIPPIPSPRSPLPPPLARSVSLSQRPIDWPPYHRRASPPVYASVRGQRRLGGTNGGGYERKRENAENEENGGDGLFLFQERSFEYEYALIDS